MQFVVDIALTLVYILAFLIVCAWTWRFWMLYINQKFLNKMQEDFVMLEIKLPREISKSPFATEVALSSLLQKSGYGTWYQKYVEGRLPFYSSLEIASIEGIIHFYVRVHKNFRSLTESNFYAQYPGIEIVEADDYTKLIRFTHLSKDVGCWGEVYKLTETWTPKNEKNGEELKKGKDAYKMPADFFPIKTYVDYGLDKNPYPENQIDPMTPMLEMMGSLKKGEHMWFQIILQDEGLYDDKSLHKLYVNEAEHKHMSLVEMAERFKKQVRSSFIEKGTVAKDDYGYEKWHTRQTGEKDAEGKPVTVTEKVAYQEDKVIAKKDMDLSVEDKWKIEETNKKFGKPLAVVVMRMLYIHDSTKAKFNVENIQNVLNWPKPFNGANKIGFRRATDPYNYTWEDTKGRRKPWRAEEIFESYVEREAFYPHIPFPGTRDWLEAREDQFFWGSDMKTRKTWRMFYEALFHPFFHQAPSDAFTMNLEEIASVWHLPGEVATTPSLPRIDSAKGVAPVNIPQ
jgi:hypothetical protein